MVAFSLFPMFGAIFMGLSTLHETKEVTNVVHSSEYFITLISLLFTMIWIQAYIVSDKYVQTKFMGQVEEENGGEIDLPPSEIIKEGENNYDKY